MGLFNRSRTETTDVPPRRSKWKRRLLGSIVLIVGLIVVSPVLVAQTPLRNWIAAKALAQLQGDIHIGGASLWWFSPPAFSDIEVRDLAGRTILHAPRIECGESLLALLRHPTDLGEWRLTQPSVRVVCSGDSTNLEKAAAYWLQSTDNAPDTGPALEGVGVRIECTQASLVVEDEDTGRTWTVDPVDLSLALPRDRRTDMRIKLNAAMTDARTTGRLNAELTAHLVERNGEKPRLRAEGQVRVEDVPLSAAEPFVRRFEPLLKLDGRLNANLTLKQGDGTAGSADAQLEGTVGVSALALSDPLLGSDCLRLARVEMPCRIALDGSRLLIEQFEVKSDVGKVSLAGAVDLAKGLRDAVAQAGQCVDAEINLARVADLVPNTLHLTKDTRIASGSLALHLHSSTGADMVRWEGDLRTSDLCGVVQGQPITWKSPLAVVFAAHQDAKAWPVVERFHCDADFLHVDLSGTIDEWTARADFNLGRLGEHLADFVDLGALRVQGEGTVRATTKRTQSGSQRLEGDVRIVKLNATGPHGHSWREDNVSARVDVVGVSVGATYKVQAGGLHILAGADGIDLDLLEPIADVETLRASAHARVHGDLTRWAGRLGVLTAALDGARIGGQIELDTRLRYAAEAVQFEEIKATGRAIQLQGFGLCVDEPTLDFTTAGRWLPAKETLELQQTRLSCPTVTVLTPSVSIGVDRAGAMQIASAATVQADVARLRRSLLAPPNGPDTVGGTLAGRIDLRPDDGRQIVRLDLSVQNLAFGSPAAPSWREPRIQLTGEGVYDLLKDSLQIVKLHVDSPTLSCDASGGIAALRGDMDLSLEGKLSYDLEKLEPQLRPYLGQGVKLNGRDARPFRIAGALAAATGQSPSLLSRLRGEAGMNWQTLQAMGCQVGQGELKGRLVDGWFRAAPIEATLDQGRLRLEPSLRLAPGPFEVYLAKGRTIERARLTPAACASALGYALPVLADVAQAEGELSLDLDGGRVPLTDPLRAEISGRLIIHSAQVSGGPLVRELSVLLKGPPTLTLARENVVTFQVVNGRVYHRDLELHFPELTVRTSGSVGMDGSLSLVAEMPVPPKWLGSSKFSSAIANQRIRLPIGGTLSKPRIDQVALRAASAQFARNAAENVIRQEIDNKLRNEVDNKLKKFLRPGK